MKNSNSNNTGSENSQSQGSNWRAHNTNQRGGRMNKGRGRGINSNNSPVCQVCGKTGHTVAYCYFKYDQTYMGSVPTLVNNVLNANSSGGHPAYLANANTVSDPIWYMDTGTSNNITNDITNLDQISNRYGKNEFLVGNGNKIQVCHTGTSHLPRKNFNLKMTRVLHAPKITKNLLSVSQLTCDNNIVVEFNTPGCYIKDKTSGKLLLQGQMADGLYEFKKPKVSSYLAVDSINYVQSGSTNDVAFHYVVDVAFHSANVLNYASNNTSATAVTQTKSMKEKWHLKMGHPSDIVLCEVLKLCKVKFNGNEKIFCEPYQLEKHHALPFKLSDSYASTPLELVHTDVWGPSPLQSSSGFKYYVQFLDDHSRYSWIYLLKNKHEPFNAFVQFKTQVEKQFERKIKTLQRDWG